LVGHSISWESACDASGPGFGGTPPIAVVPASRTDVGVHASGQSFHVSLPQRAQADVADVDGLRVAVNDILRSADRRVLVLALERAPRRFNAAFSSCGKRYRYTFHDGRTPPPETMPNGWGVQFKSLSSFRAARQLSSSQPKRNGLNISEMDEMARRFCGQPRNFRLFTRGRDSNDSIREVQRARVVRTANAQESDIDAPMNPDGDFVHFFVDGKGFLHYQVRCMASAVLQVGLGKETASDLASRCFSPPDDFTITAERLIFPSAEPEGLSLQTVFYAEPVFGALETCRPPMGWPLGRIPGDT
jgi:tRNA pseudouridine(38-40) synthase